MKRIVVWLCLAAAATFLSSGLQGQSYLNLPLSFEANRGQSDARVRYLARGANYALSLTSDEAVLSLSEAGREALPLRLRLLGANPTATVEGDLPLTGKSNYFRGNNPARWLTGIPQYARVRYHDVYPGIDLVYYGTASGRLEYDFVVAPGVDPKQIQLAFDCTKLGHIDRNSGDLLLSVGKAQIRNQKPRVYQYVRGERREVTGRYIMTGANRVRFDLGSYDRSAELVIDPVIIYATTLGTSGASSGLAVAVDGSGTYVTGSTTDSNFPTQNAFQSALVAQKDVFVTKVDPTGTTLIYSTYIGGSGSDEAHGIAVDSTGNAYITGYTFSADYPTHAPLQASLSGTINGFVTKLSPNGASLVYSTYLGGELIDNATGIAIDPSGNAYVAGYTLSTHFPTVSALQATLGGTSNAFVAKINPAGSALVYSTYLGGSGADAAYAIALDSATNVYLAGSTSSTNFPTVNPLQAANAGGGDAFIAKLNAAGSALVFSTYYGGSGQDDAYGIALDASNNIYVSGYTQTPSAFPTVNPMPASGTPQAGFALKVNAAGSSVVYATTLASNGMGIAVDSFGNAYLTGLGMDGGGSAVTLALRVNPAGIGLDYAYQVGSALTNLAQAIAIDSAGNAYVAGQGSINTQLTPPGSPSSSSTFVSLAKIGESTAGPRIGAVQPATAPLGTSSVNVKVFGTGFVSGATVNLNGSARATTFVSATEVDTTFSGADLTTAGPQLVTVVNSGGATSNSAAFTVVYPQPTIGTLSPPSASAGGPTFTLTVTGTGFVTGASPSTVYWNGSARTTTFVSSTQLTAQILNTDIAAGGTANVQVSAPAPGGGLSAVTTFSVTNPAPTVTSISPSTLAAGGSSFTLTVQGTGFTQNSVVQWGGSARTTVFASKIQLKATILAADLAQSGPVQVTVFTPTPGGGTSSTGSQSLFTVSGNSVPTVSSLSPQSVIAGSSAFTLTVTGTGYVPGTPGSVVLWNNVARTTAFVSSTQLTITVQAADVAAIGSANITVSTPGPGGGTSSPALVFSINGNPAPTVSSISPSSANAGSNGFTLTVTGTGFVAGSSIYWNNVSRASTILSTTQISTPISAADIADGSTIPVQVFVPSPGGGLSQVSPATTFTINNPVPSMATLSPNTLPVGGNNFTLVVTGTGFTPSSIVKWNGNARSTTFNSSTQLSAAIPSSDIASAGTPTITVFNQAPSGGTSTGLVFTITANPVPAITGISPSVLGAGTGDFTLIVTGTGFLASSTVQWNANARTTTFVSATQLTAAIPASDVSGVGTATVTVFNPTPGGGTSATQTFTISSGCIYYLTPSATSFSVNSANGTVTVAAPTGCPWTASTTDSFLAITGGASGSGGGTVQFSVAANTGAARNGTLSIAGQNIAITQSASIQGTITPTSAGGSAGNTARVPVNLVLNTSVSVDKVAFSLQLTPNGAAPALAAPLTFSADAALPAPFVDNSQPGIVSVSWLSLATPLSGTVHLGDVIVTIPGTANVGQTYAAQITGATASLANSGVTLSTGSNATVSVVLDYLVGDVFPSTGNSVGHFGDGSVDSLDLIAVLRAATNVPGFTPPPCTDLFDAMDAFPADTATTRGGDGSINTLDLLAVLRKATNVDTSRPRRVPKTSCPVVSVQSKRAAPLAPEAAIEIDNGAVYLHAYRDLDLQGLALSLGSLSFGSADSRGLSWTSGNFRQSVIDSELPGTIALAWLTNFTLRAGDRVLLGSAQSGATLKVHGASAIEQAKEQSIGREIPLTLPTASGRLVQ